MIWIHKLFEFPLRKVLFYYGIVRCRPALNAKFDSSKFSLRPLELSPEHGF